MARKPKIETLDEIIHRVGGPSLIADWIGITPAGVSNMRGRGRLPPEYWVCFVTKAREAGHALTYEYLAEVHASFFDTLPKGYKIQFA